MPPAAVAAGGPRRVCSSCLSRQASLPYNPHAPDDACCPPLLPLLLQEDRGQKRLQFLLKQAEVFQHFAPLSQKAQEGKKKKRGRHGGYTEEQEDEGGLVDGV